MSWIFVSLPRAFVCVFEPAWTTHVTLSDRVGHVIRAVWWATLLNGRLRPYRPAIWLHFPASDTYNCLISWLKCPLRVRQLSRRCVWALLGCLTGDHDGRSVASCCEVMIWFYSLFSQSSVYDYWNTADSRGYFYCWFVTTQIISRITAQCTPFPDCLSLKYVYV